ncbi:glycogen/starch/alpha-glucan phosphorylase [Omnitrophica bacterium]|nr:glycogen/starch/alpha-glucan phosphorylase [Candidatus Omnitrophota bacterium]
MSSQKIQKKPWELVHKKMTKEAIKKSFNASLYYGLAKDEYSRTSHDEYMALAFAVRDRLVERWIVTQQGYHKKNAKRVYYLSMEFLIGRLMGNNLMNLGLWEEAKSAMEEMGFDIEEIRDEEVDAGLGNGGLGRLAACFLDSMATLGIPAHGYGIRYDYGIFQQRIVNGYQVEAPDEWLKNGNPWEFARPEYARNIQFYGRTETLKQADGNVSIRWVDTQNVMAMPFDIPVPGYQNNIINTLRLWSAKSTDEFDFKYFNDGDYERAVYDKMFSENISKALYPNDNNAVGKELRLKQEHFFTSASISDIIRRFKADNQDLRLLPQKAAIQLNDTHPALGVAEYMRLLMDQENLDWDTAWDITTKTFGYTNHTVMPEALECWPVDMFGNLLPRHMQIIYEINARFLKEIEKKFPGDKARMRRMSLIQEGNPKQIRMAHLAIVGSHSVNGVSELHSLLIQQRIFKDFYEMMPEKFNNKTNGITQRRWLLKANPLLSDLISAEIGPQWVGNLYHLEHLMPLREDTGFQEKWRQIKKANKKQLAKIIYESNGVRVNEDSIFDVQIKRLHEYKRQSLLALYILSEYLRLKKDPKAAFVPRTFIISGKAAPGYFMAKLLIKFVSGLADKINKDPEIGDKMKVVFLANYRVSLAEKIFPASDLSEQISTAGTEASGTGCMKFMINGALTVGTWDGANIEMASAMGSDNMFSFGLKADEIQTLRKKGYNPKTYIAQSSALQELFDSVGKNQICPDEPDIFKPLIDNLSHYDPFLVCADFEAYRTVQEQISENYRDQADWTRKAIINVAKSGRFSSDRTIAQYAREIWDVPCKMPKLTRTPKGVPEKKIF